MRLIHLSDLHVGKRVNEFSMLEDQRFILNQILEVIEREAPDGVILAGDIYDRSTPGDEAVRLFDEFLTRLAGQKVHVFIISGNHDSAVRLSFASGLIDASGIHIAPVYGGRVEPFTLTDEHGKVNIFMLPFIKPAVVRAIFPEERIEDYTDACRVAIDHMELADDERNVLVAHQFVTGAIRSESEEISVGGLDNVDARVFGAFDYVALGHIHSPQQAGGDTIRYCGTPLKYSFSEAGDTKSVTIVELGEKGNVSIRCEKLCPLRDMRTIRGTYRDLTTRDNYILTQREDYIHAILTDEEDVVDAVAKLRIIYPNLMKLSYDNKRTREHRLMSDAPEPESKSPIQLFGEFYETQNNQEMSEQQKRFMEGLIGSVWEERV